ncbi:MAG: tRNA (cytidine(34)-2'-O)-methyltransferase [Rhodospirillaceae bacterium]
MRLALYQPDIPQNTGAMMRLGACFRVPLDVIEPCGFPFDDKRLKRTAMDYGGACEVRRHASWEAYLAARGETGGRLVLLTTAAATTYTDFSFRPGDSLLLGRESRGVPDEVRTAAEAAVRIPIAAEMRSLNVTTAAAIVLTEALRQIGLFSGKTTL